MNVPQNHADTVGFTREQTGHAIISVDCFPVRLPLRKPLVMASSCLRDAPILYVRIRSRNGAEGWGEAVSSLTNSGETLAGMVALVDDVVRPLLLGASVFERSRIMSRLRASIFANGGALAAVDMALLDLMGHVRGAPLVELLGGALRQSVQPIWIVGGAGSAEADCQEAVALHSQGARAFKLKVGIGSIDNDVRTVGLLREALGSDCLISADANMAWDVHGAIRFARAAAVHRLDFLEQPVVPDVARLAAVARASPVAIGADESIHGSPDVLALAQAHAVGGVSLKSIKLGGVSPAVALAGLGDALALSIGLAMMMESSLATAAMVHVACAVPQIDWGLNLGNVFLAEDPVCEPLGCTDGMAHCPVGPGIGVSVDERRLMKFKVD